MKGAEEHGKVKLPSAEDLAAAEASVAQQEASNAAAKEKGDKKKLKKGETELAVRKNALEALRKQSRVLGGIPRAEDGAVDYAEDFFGKQAYLTVSGQLEGEAYACAISKVYTFGPTFRAEKSFTSRHLAEFWMIEPEMAFCDLQDDMRCAEDYVRFCCKHLLATCMPDLEFMNKMVDQTCLERLRLVAESPFQRCSYTEAIALLEKAIAEGKKFEYPVEWGIDLQSEHERFITEQVFKCPTIVYDYPKDIKAFYMRLNDDGKTVAAMDVLVPKVGELIGGSQREDR